MALEAGTATSTIDLTQASETASAQTSSTARAETIATGSAKVEPNGATSEMLRASSSSSKVS